MLKIFCTAILLLLGSWLCAQEVIFEYYAGEVAGTIILPYTSVIFPKDKEQTTYQVFMRIKADRGKWQNVIENRSFSIPRREWLKDTALTYEFSFAAMPGDYNAELIMRDKNTGVKRSYSKRFSLPIAGTEIGMTWLEIERDEISFIPSDLNSELPEAESITLSQYYSLPMDSLRIAVNDQYLVITNPSSPLQLDLKPYISGSEMSKLRVACFDDNIQYNLEPFLYTPWFSYSMHYSASDQLEQLRYIASQNEWQVLSKLPPAKHQEAVEGFWRAHDPSPETLRNETREAFCARVVTADERYTIHKKLKGWKSDLGRIYIKYGEPDDIQSEVYPLGRYPNIIWTYYRANKQFIFADIKGFGQYSLRNKEDEY